MYMSPKYLEYKKQQQKERMKRIIPGLSGKFPQQTAESHRKQSVTLRSKRIKVTLPSI
jgi:hypothetical protein